MSQHAGQNKPRTVDELLDPRLVSRLSGLDIASRKVFRGKVKGERRSKRRGESVEFADHRPYVVGDDLRHVDWNIYGRLDRLFLKLYQEEEDLSLHLVLDCSGSTDFGQPNKFVYMQRVAMALGYVGLVNLNRVSATAIARSEDSTGVLGGVQNLRGRRRLHELGRWLCSLVPGGDLPFTDACRRIALSRSGRGVMVLLSDLLVKEGYQDGLRLLAGRGYDLVVVQVLSPQELEPSLGGDVRLRDVEDRDHAEVTISAPLLRRYRRVVESYLREAHAFCTARGIVHLSVSSDRPVESLLLEDLRGRGVLR
ncbi:MAG: hypothetical protein KatS3mg103_0148 [Phycisphaerales bacterium]|nr:MAG: hypothetical protein KatS3mg103_0148 [Phycisphaerales bacterium]